MAKDALHAVSVDASAQEAVAALWRLCRTRHHGHTFPLLRVVGIVILLASLHLFAAGRAPVAGAATPPERRPFHR